MADLLPGIIARYGKISQLEGNYNPKGKKIKKKKFESTVWPVWPVLLIWLYRISMCREILRLKDKFWQNIRELFYSRYGNTARCEHNTRDDSDSVLESFYCQWWCWLSSKTMGWNKYHNSQPCTANPTASPLYFLWYADIQPLGDLSEAEAGKEPLQVIPKPHSVEVEQDELKCNKEWMRQTSCWRQQFTPFAEIPIPYLSYTLSLFLSSYLVTPHAPLREHISTACTLDCWALFHVHVSDPYVKVGKRILFLKPLFTYINTFLPLITC